MPSYYDDEAMDGAVTVRPLRNRAEMVAVFRLRRSLPSVSMTSLF